MGLLRLHLLPFSVVSLKLVSDLMGALFVILSSLSLLTDGRIYDINSIPKVVSYNHVHLHVCILHGLVVDISTA